MEGDLSICGKAGMALANKARLTSLPISQDEQTKMRKKELTFVTVALRPPLTPRSASVPRYLPPQRIHTTVLYCFIIQLISVVP